MRFDLQLFKISSVRPIKGQDGRLTRLPVASRQRFSNGRPARPALGLRALAHGAPPLDKVIIFQESHFASRQRPLLRQYHAAGLPSRRALRTAAAAQGRARRSAEAAANGWDDRRSKRLVAEPRGYGQSGARGESGCRAEARAASRQRFFASRQPFFLHRLRHVARRQPSQDAREA